MFGDFGQKKVFIDRREAGRQLGQKLLKYKDNKGVVFGIARGGVLVAAEVGRSLGWPVSVLVVRKLGMPGNPELGVGAVGEGRVEVLDAETLGKYGLSRKRLREVIREEKREVQRRKELYRQGKSLKGVSGKTVIVCDDGIAMGVTAMAAVLVVRKQKPRKVILATPVCAGDSATKLAKEVFELVCLESPKEMSSIGRFYREFGQVSDEEVRELLGEKG